MERVLALPCVCRPCEIRRSCSPRSGRWLRTAPRWSSCMRHGTAPRTPCWTSRWSWTRHGRRCRCCAAHLTLHLMSRCATSLALQPVHLVHILPPSPTSDFSALENLSVCECTTCPPLFTTVGCNPTLARNLSHALYACAWGAWCANVVVECRWSGTPCPRLWPRTSER